MIIIPMSLKVANEFVTEHHRHNKKVTGHKFSIGLEKEGELIGVAIVGRPVARMLDNGKTVEILRVCVKGKHKNANSKLYGRCVKISELMGFESVITYTLTTELQSSLKAIGARIVARTKTQLWDRPSRPREYQSIYEVPKFRWELTNEK